MLTELCKEYTNLSQQDILELKSYAEKLEVFSQITETDLFIDCLMKNGTKAIVVFHQRPLGTGSIFSQKIEGIIVSKDKEPAVMRTLLTGIPSKNLNAITTMEGKIVWETVIPIKNANGQVIGALISEHDITEQINQGKQMRVMEETTKELSMTIDRLKAKPGIITEYVNEAIIIFNHYNKAVHVNQEAVALYQKMGYIDDIVGMDIHNLLLDIDMITLIETEKKDFEKEVSIGDLILHIRYILMDTEYGKTMIMLVRDLTEIRSKEKEIVLKSVAMQEIHHRVKNNLQTIASILQLQLRRSDNIQVRAALQENINRILSIAITHDILTRHSIDSIDMKELLMEVRNSLFTYITILEKEINIDIQGESFVLPSKTGSDVALVINELVSNSIEHGFPECREGNISIHMEDSEEWAIFIVLDDGLGFLPEQVKKSSLGLHIVRVLIEEKLCGKLRISSNNKGTKVWFSIKK